MTSTRDVDSLVVLSGGGSTVVLRRRRTGLPEIVHWGTDLGDLSTHTGAQLVLAGKPPVPQSGLDDPWPLTLLPTEADGWSGRPGLSAHRDGLPVVPSFAQGARCEVTTADDGGQVEISAEDSAAGVRWECTLDMDQHGVLSVAHRLTNTGKGLLHVDEMVTALPLPSNAGEILDLTGRWCRERHPQRSALQHGGKIRESRRGRTGHDATLLMVAGEPGFTFSHGEVCAVHVAWSGDHLHLVDRLPEGAGRHTAIIAGGELLRPGEMRLAPGDSYDAPAVIFVRSLQGLDGVSAALHGHIRERPGHPTSPRPVTVNSWEALYFDHDPERVDGLVDAAAQVGAERFVLDDGWFTGRRDPSRGLGDWQVDSAVWPKGLRPLADRVRGYGMQMGLWVEPEMVNLDSDLARAHPDWVLAPGRPAPRTRAWRGQQVLDLTHPHAYEHVLKHLDTVIRDVGVDYLKWDHNRDLHEALDSVGLPAVRRQTLATYAMMAELQRSHPGLEIESCASGGARVDLGVLGHTHRVWPSDCNDPVERQTIQRWTSLLLPPELQGTHVGPESAHTTGRVTTLNFRCITAMFGHAGIEWDLTALDESTLALVTGWVALHKRLRPLLHTGRTVRADEVDGAWWHGVISHDRQHAIISYVRLTTSALARPGLVRIPGLDPDTRYQVRAVDPTGSPEALLHGQVLSQPPWCQQGVVLSGAMLAGHGLAMPVLDPAAAVLIEIVVESAGEE